MTDWNDITIGEAAEFTSKPRGLIYSDLLEIPFVPMDLVPVDNTYIQNHVLKPGKDIRSGNYFEKGDCLIAKITPCFENGKQGIVRDLPADFGVASTELIPFRGRKGLSNKFFLFYFFLEATTRRQIAQKMEGATGRQRIPISVLKDWPISLPPLPEQKKIAAVLLKLQRAIETQEQITQSLRDLKKSTMQHVFTRGLRGEKTKMTEIGEIPEIWEVYPLSELREFLQYGTSKRCTLDRRGVAVLRIPNIVGGKIDTQELKYADFPSAERERLILQDGDILFVRTNGQKILVGRTAVYKGNPSPALFASYLIRARLQLKLIRPDFLQYYTGTASGVAHLSGRATPAADGKFNINTKTIDSVSVPVPDLREQDKIVRTIDSVARKLVVHESKKSALQDLFKTTLNKLMTGGIRVQDLDIDISGVEG